ncbi:insulinase family protein [Simkania negevensis]|uniref:Insulinase family protein n=1 Tax=Simkania negevensis TaxID=83561 RepID=A0ABS3ARL1_9BACT|nr:insulinase family protein [Simkania negevensis]
MKLPEYLTHFHTFSNGLRLVVVELPDAYTVSCGIFARVGSRYEEREKMGLSHFIEHLLFRGSKRYGAREITQLIEGEGGALNAYTAEESTCYHVKTFPDNLMKSLDILVDMFCSPSFSEADVTRERGVICEEIRSHLDHSQEYIADLFSRLVWKEHPLGNCVMGREEQIQSYTVDDLYDFYKSYYCAANTTIAIAGAVDHRELFDWIAKNEERFAIGPASHYLPCEGDKAVQDVVYEEKEGEQTYLQFGTPCCNRYSPERWPAALCSTILGGNMSSRLFETIREELGYAYHIVSDVEFYEDTGCFSVECSTEPNNALACYEKSMEVIRLLANSVDEAELVRAKRYLVGQFAQEMEDTMDTMLSAGDKLMANEKREEFSVQQMVRSIESVSLGQVTEFAKKIVAQPCWSLALIGPKQWNFF